LLGRPRLCLVNGRSAAERGRRGVQPQLLHPAALILCALLESIEIDPAQRWHIGDGDRESLPQQALSFDAEG
jgi:hypothetical protein